MFGQNSKHQPDLEMFVIYDSKVQAYRDPIFAVNREVLVRTIVNEFTDERYSRTDMFNNAEDFSIYKCGSYDRKTGKFQIQNHDHVINVIEIRALAAKKMAEQKKQAINDMRSIQPNIDEVQIPGH